MVGSVTFALRKRPQLSCAPPESSDPKSKILYTFLVSCYTFRVTSLAPSCEVGREPPGGREARDAGARGLDYGVLYIIRVFSPVEGRTLHIVEKC